MSGAERHHCPLAQIWRRLLNLAIWQAARKRARS
jgi:hypothetical protein